MENKRYSLNHGMLTAALVIAIIGAVFALVGGISCLACFAWAQGMLDEAEYILGYGYVYDIPVEVWVLSIGAAIAGVVAVVGAALVKKGGFIAPILLLAAGIFCVVTIIIVNILGLVGGILIIIAGILALVARVKRIEEVDFQPMYASSFDGINQAQQAQSTTCKQCNANVSSDAGAFCGFCGAVL